MLSPRYETDPRPCCAVCATYCRASARTDIPTDRLPPTTVTFTASFTDSRQGEETVTTNYRPISFLSKSTNTPQKTSAFLYLDSTQDHAIRKRILNLVFRTCELLTATRNCWSSVIHNFNLHKKGDVMIITNYRLTSSLKQLRIFHKIIP